MITGIYYLGAFVIAAIVTFILPGTSSEGAFVDAMGMFISLILFCFGVAHAVDGFNKGRNK